VSPNPDYAIKTLKERLEYLRFRTRPGIPETPKRIEQVEAAIKLLLAQSKPSPT
jgi:hypothetical protein